MTPFDPTKIEDVEILFQLQVYAVEHIRNRNLFPERERLWRVADEDESIDLLKNLDFALWDIEMRKDNV